MAYYSSSHQMAKIFVTDRYTQQQADLSFIAQPQLELSRGRKHFPPIAGNNPENGHPNLVPIDGVIRLYIATNVSSESGWSYILVQGFTPITSITQVLPMNLRKFYETYKPDMVSPQEGPPTSGTTTNQSHFVPEQQTPTQFDRGKLEALVDTIAKMSEDAKKDETCVFVRNSLVACFVQVLTMRIITG
ncbi:hypothetical protein PR048_002199 [Dryococelus australis]|uniref:Uncharacterized protein n=1 Tax=Dryococelus australis TaxID=614101 RepID=A0ABQ9IJJ0_9NEOP|nr:hypothetical protein PR048_002199 [Dryococelus australis]